MLNPYEPPRERNDKPASRSLAAGGFLGALTALALLLLVLTGYKVYFLVGRIAPKQQPDLTPLIHGWLVVATPLGSLLGITVQWFFANQDRSSQR